MDCLKLTHDQLLKFLQVERLENPFTTLFKSRYYYSLMDKLRNKGYYLVVINQVINKNYNNYETYPIYTINKVENILYQKGSIEWQ